MITSFSGTYRWLSNFWPCEVELDEETYPTVEHAYQAAKSLDPVIRKQIQQLETPGQAKRAGRTFQPRSDWDEVKDEVMLSLLKQKFERADLKKMLEETGSRPIGEGNTWGDTYWGCVMREGRWVGQNRLGKMLMRIRRENRA